MYKDKMGRWRSKSLFWETNRTPEYAPVFVLADEDRHDLPSAQRLFVECEDPTGYAFAVKYLHSYDHWKQLAEKAWLKPIIDKWVEETNARLLSKAIKQMVSDCDSGDTKASTAAKWLAEKRWEKSGRKAGRPTKAEVRRHLKDLEISSDEMDEDFKRLQIGISDD